MNDLLTKIQEKLIHALGGMTKKECTFTRYYEVIPQAKRVIELEAEVITPRIVDRELVEQELYRQLAVEMEQHHYGVIQESEDIIGYAPWENQRKYRLKVRLVEE